MTTEINNLVKKAMNKRGENTPPPGPDPCVNCVDHDCDYCEYGNLDNEVISMIDFANSFIFKTERQ